MPMERIRRRSVLLAVSALATVCLCAGSAQAVSLDMLTISMPANITVPATMPCGQSYCAQVLFSPTASGGTPPYRFVCSSDGSSFLFLVGSRPVSCMAQDAAGNSTPMATFTITVTEFVRDTTPPVFQNVPPIVATADDSGRAVLAYPLPTATDDSGGPVQVRCDWHGGPDAFPLGTTTATCTATDQQGNTATTTFTITVVRAGTTAPATPTTTGPGTTTSTPATQPGGGTTTGTTTVTQPTTTTSAPLTPREQALQDQIDALSAEIAALKDRLSRIEKAGDAASLAFEQAVADGMPTADAADLARGTYLNAEYGLGEFAP